MRALLVLAVLVVGCGEAEPIGQAQFPIGCWSAPPTELDLVADGTMRQSGGPSSVVGTWKLQGDVLELTNGTALQLWHVTQLGPTEMQTDSGNVTHWQSVACH